MSCELEFAVGIRLQVFKGMVCQSVEREEMVVIL